LKSKAVSGMMLTLLFIGMLTLVSNIQPAKAWTGGTIQIRADGSVDPDTAPISSVDNITYTLTDDVIYNQTTGGAIVVERDNIVLDGANHTLQGQGYIHLNSYGIFHSGIGTHRNITIKNLKVTEFGAGLHLYNSFDIIISENNITNNWDGIRLFNSSFSTISGNNITKHDSGICLYDSSNNKFYHNNLDNIIQQVDSTNSTNTWDDGYPSGGNYWSDHVCTGNPSHGSQPYIINQNNTDHYPFQDPNGWLLAPVGGVWVPVDKLALLAPYIALASTILVAIATTAIYVKRKKKRQ